jgi:hypothetical protein
MMDLGKHVVDKELLDCNGLRAGKADDLLLDIGQPRADGTLPFPEVEAIITGPMALSIDLPRPAQWVTRLIYRLLGVAHPEPVTIDWDHVVAIDVVAHLDIDRERAGLMELANAVNRRFIGRLPGA